MTSLFVVLLAVVAFALCSMREPTPDARTPAQMRQALQQAGWLRCTGRAVLLTGVPALYVLAATCWMCWHTARAIGFILTVLAEHLDALTARPRLEETPA